MDLIDTHPQPWIDRGGKIALRVMASEDRFVHATPTWVEDAGARGIHDHSGQKCSPDAESGYPIFDDPVVLEKLGNFLAAMTERCNGNPNVAFVDIGSFGLWGEGLSRISHRFRASDGCGVGECLWPRNTRLHPSVFE